MLVDLSQTLVLQFFFYLDNPNKRHINIAHVYIIISDKLTFKKNVGMFFFLLLRKPSLHIYKITIVKVLIQKFYKRLFCFSLLTLSICTLRSSELNTSVQTYTFSCFHRGSKNHPVHQLNQNKQHQTQFENVHFIGFHNWFQFGK